MFTSDSIHKESKNIRVQVGENIYSTAGWHGSVTEHPPMNQEVIV